MSLVRYSLRFSTRNSLKFYGQLVINPPTVTVLNNQNRRLHIRISDYNSLLRTAPHFALSDSLGKHYYAKQMDRGGKGKKGSGKHVVLSDQELSELINYPRMLEQMNEVIDHLKQEYIKQLSIRSNIGSFEHLTVESEDGKFPLNQIAQITQKGPALVAINCAAMSKYLPAVKTALEKSGMNINPQVDKNTIFIPLPKVTREHRETLAKSAKTLSDKSKDKLRDIHNKYQREAKKKSDASADLVYNVVETILKKLHEFQASCDDLMKKKQEELLQNK